MVEAKTRPVEPERRAVVLGASNIARGLPTVVTALERAWGEPLDLLTAAGHGRSYGLTTCVLGRTLPSIVSSGLWRALEAREPLPTAALVTDIGNDIAYGASVSQITEWVETCLERLCKVCQSIVMTRLPLCNLEHLPAWRFQLLRRILFPRSRLTFEQALQAARDLDGALVQLAERYRVTLAPPQAAWYGVDPIHVKFNCISRAWCEVLRSLSQEEFNTLRAMPLALQFRLKTAQPERYRRFAIERRASQPAVRLPNGTVVSLY